MILPLSAYGSYTSMHKYAEVGKLLWDAQASDDSP